MVRSNTSMARSAPPGRQLKQPWPYEEEVADPDSLGGSGIGFENYAGVENDPGAVEAADGTPVGLSV